MSLCLVLCDISYLVVPRASCHICILRGVSKVCEISKIAISRCSWYLVLRGISYFEVSHSLWHPKHRGISFLLISRTHDMLFFLILVISRTLWYIVSRTHLGAIFVGPLMTGDGGCKSNYNTRNALPLHISSTVSFFVVSRTSRYFALPSIYPYFAMSHSARHIKVWGLLRRATDDR